MKTYREQYEEYLGFFREALKNECAEMNFRPPVLAESMKYSLLSGGKRVRPVLFFASLEHFGMNYRGETAFPVALECIHTYSLIHDDLPAMDNDDFRRGNPSNHKVFGEAGAILAGDGLLSYASGILLKEAGRSRRHLRAAQFLMEAAGAAGMVAGQSADLIYSGKDAGEEELRFIYEHKTGRLIEAPVRMATILAGGDEEAASAFGRELGLLFQMTDDILDEKGESGKLGKTAGKDRMEGKLTCVKVFGLDGAELLADRTAAKCLSALDAMGGDPFLKELVKSVRERDN